MPDLESANIDESYQDLADRTPLAQILTPNLTPERMALMLKLKAPQGHEWIGDHITERLCALGEPGMGAYRVVVNEFFHASRYATETRQEIKRATARKRMSLLGDIASKAIRISTYAEAPPPVQTYQHPQLMTVAGVTVLAGRPKIGKSYLALNLALAVSQGGVFASHFPMQYGGDVLYLALEDNAGRMWGRICALLGDQASTPENFWITYSAPTLEENMLIQEIEGWIALPEVKQPRLIVIDIFRLVQTHRGRQDDIYELEYNDMTQLNTLAQAHDMHILIVTHLNKSYSSVDDMADAIMSSTAITGGAGGIWVMASRGEELCDVELHISGKDVPRWGCALQQIKMEGQMDWKALGDVETVIQGDVSTEVLTVLYAWEGRAPTQTELKDVLDSGIDKGNFSRLLKKMRAEGLIMVSHSRYHLTESGSNTAEILNNSDNSYNTYNFYNSYNSGEEGDINQEDNNNPWEGNVDDTF